MSGIRKYSLILISFMTSLVVSATAEAAPIDFNGGVNNEYKYEEYVFISGEPIKFTGEVSVRERERNGELTEAYRFNLTSPKGDLRRNVTYVTELVERDDKGQTTSQTTVTNFTETIDIGEDTYTLEDYQLSQAAVSDNRPASDYYAGNLAGRKAYIHERENGDEEELIVTLSGRSVGYKNFWGTTETQLIDYEIETDNWLGTVSSQVSNSKTKHLEYQEHDPSLSSFSGGHVRVSYQDMVGSYDYDLPATVGSGTAYVSQEMSPQVERFIVPKFRDLDGHWAKDNIEQLYSLDVLEESSQFFSPNVPMTRYQFTKAVMRAADIRVLEEEPAGRNRQPVPREAVFVDLDPRDEDYKYVEGAVEKGIIKGVTPDEFRPTESLTRAQAITILIRALGMEHRAPSPGYRTSFTDDSEIPFWALDSFYVAADIGLIQGDTQNRANPRQSMTKAEAATMIIRFLNFLENDLQQDYRDNMLYYN